MDNLTHSLAGWALAETGLKRRTRLGTVTLILGANLPDLDVVSYLVGSGTDALAFRRGWTHGILAMLLLPVLLTLAVRWLGDRGPGTGDRTNPRGLLLLAAVGVWSHPLLDLLNTYGVRLLMPFSGRWFYGDALFIVDPWLMVLLGLGIGLGRRSPGGRPARIALAIAAGYALAMAAAGRITARQAERAAGGGALRTLAAPGFADPRRWRIIRELPDGYEVGRVELPGPYRPAARYFHDPGPAIRDAARTPAGRTFLVWSRFPFVVRDSTGLRILDLRYGTPAAPGWASVWVGTPGSFPR